MGRNRLPDAIKKAKGTFRADQSSPLQPNFTEVVTLEAPDGLSEDAAMYFRDISQELLKTKVLKETDSFMFLALFNEIDTYIKLNKIIFRMNDFTFCDKNGVWREHPEFAMRRKALLNITNIGAKFGLTPADRQRLIVAPVAKMQSKLEQILNK